MLLRCHCHKSNESEATLQLSQCPTVRLYVSSSFYNFTSNNHNCRRQLSCCQILPATHAARVTVAVAVAGCMLHVAAVSAIASPSPRTCAWRVVNSIWLIPALLTMRWYFPTSKSLATKNHCHKIAPICWGWTQVNSSRLDCCHCTDRTLSSMTVLSWPRTFFLDNHHATWASFCLSCGCLARCQAQVTQSSQWYQFESLRPEHLCYFMCTLCTSDCIY